MNVYIVGAGAVGTYLGEELKRIGNAVIYAPRDAATVEPLDIDLAIVTVKSFQTDSAIATLRRAIRNAGSTAIMTPQNGVGNEEKLAAAFGADQVIAAALTVPVGRDKAGRGVAAGGGGIVFAPVGKTSAHNWLLAAFGATGIPVSAAVDYRSLKWSKLALNVIANASCAILNVLPERLVHLSGVFELEIRAIREVRAVMKALGVSPIDLPRYPVRLLQGVAILPVPVARLALADRVAGARGNKPPSLLLDLRASKNRTEVDVLNGAVANAARGAGVSAPVNTVFARVVSDIANMPQLWAKYRERPEALEAEVAAEAARAARAYASA